MEQIFVQKIYKITEQLLSQAANGEATLRDLENHLAKARRLNMQHYEVETLNTIGIYYALTGDLSQQMHYFSTALEHAYDLNQIDPIIKLTNNLASTMISVWEIESAQKILQRGIDIIREQNLRLLGGIYVFSNMIECLLRRGEFEAALKYHDAAWTIAKNANMKGYSKIEYFQIVMALHRHKATIDVARGNADEVLDTLRLASEQISSTNRDDLEQDMQICRMYHALIILDDEAQAKTIEADVIQRSNGELSNDTALQIGYFMLFNDQYEWAQRYAKIVLDRKVDDAKPLPSIIRYADQLKQQATAKAS